MKHIIITSVIALTSLLTIAFTPATLDWFTFNKEHNRIEVNYDIDFKGKLFDTTRECSKVTHPNNYIGNATWLVMTPCATAKARVLTTFRKSDYGKRENYGTIETDVRQGYFYITILDKNGEPNLKEDGQTVISWFIIN